MLTIEELRGLVEAGEVDTVVVAFTDMQGRLMGKRLHAEFFLEQTDAGHAVEGCNYLLALEMEMDPGAGLRDRLVGAGIRRLRHRPRTGDTPTHPVARGHGARPRRRPLARLARSPRGAGRCAQLGFDAMMGSELEFFLLKETFADAAGYG